MGFGIFQDEKEAASVVWGNIKDEVQEIMAKLDQNDLNDIYNCDETGLYLKWLSSWTLDIMKRSGAKPKKADRVSVLFCTNSTGTDKRRPLILSLSHPRYLNEFTRTQLELQPDDERWVSYMQKHAFAGWLRRFQADIVTKSPHRRVLLLIDNAPGHLITSEVGFMEQILNIEILTLSKNSTSVTQPLDAGVIAVFKNYYQEFLALSTMVHRERITNGAKVTSDSIPNCTAWKHIVQAWNLVKPESIRHCFRHVPLFNERQKTALSSSLEGDKAVAMALKNIRLSIAGEEENRFWTSKPDLEGEAIEEAANEPQNLALSSDESIRFWSEDAGEQDQLDLLAINTPRERSTTAVNAAGSHPNVPLSLAALPLHGTENFRRLSDMDKTEFLSHLDTTDIYFARLSRELGGTSFVQPLLEKMRNNQTFAQFFKSPPAFPTTSSLLVNHSGPKFPQHHEDDDDSDDIDYHLPRPPEIATTVHIKEVGRGKHTKRKEFQVDETPSTGSSRHTEYDENDNKKGQQERVVLDDEGRALDREEQGEVLRKAAEVLGALEPEVFASGTVENARNVLDLTYDCSMDAKKVYNSKYIKKRKVEIIAAEKIAKITASTDTEDPEGVSNPVD